MSIYTEILTKYWGYSQFRPLQEDIIKSVADDKKDTLGLLPTGGGKSVIFQVPALAKDGICLVITPLIALMKDQVDNLNKRHIKAAAIYSGMTRDQIETTFDNCAYGNYKFLYLSPERLATELFQVRVQKLNVNLIAIDEAHCISQWGYDFRPSYLKVGELRDLLPDVPFLALTATATPEVVADIQERLGFKAPNVFKKSFERDNLTYIVRQVEDKMSYLLRIVTSMNASGVVYVRNRKKTWDIAQFLKENGIAADHYHAGLTNESKDQKQSDWKDGRLKVIVSTNAFGMGIDKADVRFVVHMDLPDSPEAYFQEAGRGGRDGERAYAVLLYHPSDKDKLLKSIESSFPPREEVRKVYAMLGNFFQLPIGAGKGQVFDFAIGDFARRYKMNIISIISCLKILQQAGYIEFSEELNTPSVIRFVVHRDDLYKFQVANAQFDSFIKLLLRTYTGLFSEYAKIDENFLAKRANTTRDVIYKYLVKLKSLGIVNYIPQRKTPIIAFTEERLDEKSVRITKEQYEVRKERYSKRVEAVIDYASNSVRCRSQLLLVYFGEKNPPRCGQCDVCKQKHESELNEYEYHTLRTALLDALTVQTSLHIDEAVKLPAWQQVEPEKARKALRWMIDNDQVIYDALKMEVRK